MHLVAHPVGRTTNPGRLQKRKSSETRPVKRTMTRWLTCASERMNGATHGDSFGVLESKPLGGELTLDEREIPDQRHHPSERDSFRSTLLQWNNPLCGVGRGMDEQFSHSEQLEHRVQMVLGVVSAKEVLPLEFKPAYSVGDLLTQHVDELEQETAGTGGVLQALSDHFAKVYQVDRAVRAA
jgi:hypothetical protein